MTIADEARANALHCEMVKYAYRQTKDGVVVSFVVHPNDIPAALSISHIGARYMVALVQIGDDERPIGKDAMPHSATERLHNAQPQPDTPRLAGAKRDWRTVPYPQQAGIRINEATFAAYLREEHSDEWHETGETDDCLKLICNINSKRELLTNHKAALLWHQIDTQYQAWIAKERVGA